MSPNANRQLFGTPFVYYILLIKKIKIKNIQLWERLLEST